VKAIAFSSLDPLVKGLTMNTRKASSVFAALAFCAPLLLAMAPAAHACADIPGMHAAHASDVSDACRQARQKALFLRELARTDGDVDPRGAQPTDCMTR
jgi:hypothetical protein